MVGAALLAAINMVDTIIQGEKSEDELGWIGSLWPQPNLAAFGISGHSGEKRYLPYVRGQQKRGI